MLGEFKDVIGLMVTLVAAAIGFSGVIYSQRALARRTREEAEADGQRELRSFQNAMVGELSALQLSLANSLELLNAQISMSQQMARMGGEKKTQPRITFLFATPVFDSHVSRIGLLSPDLSFKVSSLYGRLKSYSLQSQKDVPEMEAGLAAKVMESVGGGLIALQKELDDLKIALRTVVKS
jgi:hypothetical protein